MEKPQFFKNMSLTADMQGQIEEFKTLCSRIGLYGDIFLEEFNKTETDIIFSSVDIYEAGMSGMYEAYDQDFNFKNQITVYANYPNQQELFNTFLHEGIHAIQANISAATLANQHLHILPHDALKMMFIEELDTTAKEKLFHFLCNNLETQEEDLSDHENKDFLATWVQSQRIGSLFENIYQDRDYAKKQRDVYIDRVLSHFEDNIDYYKICDEFIQYTPIDFWETGNSLGINSFGRTALDVNITACMPMEDIQWSRLRAFEEEIQLDSKKVNTFSAYLQKRGMSREEFLIEARNDNITKKSYAE